MFDENNDYFHLPIILQAFFAGVVTEVHQSLCILQTSILLTRIGHKTLHFVYVCVVMTSLASCCPSAAEVFFSVE